MMIKKKMEDQGGRYNTKTISFSEDGPGEYAIMITRFYPEGNDVLMGEGFRNESFLYTVLTQGEGRTDYDPFRFCFQLEAADKNDLEELMVGIDTGKIDWDMIEDGSTYYPEDLSILLDHGES